MMGKKLGLAMLWVGAAFMLPAFADQISFPAWLADYPAATADVHQSDLLIEHTYTAAAQASEVLAHYRKLFEGASLSFQPNPDGIGTSIRAAAPECDLLIQIRTRSAGTFVDVNCAARITAPAKPVQVITGRTQPVRTGVNSSGPGTVSRTAPQAPAIPPDWMERHKEKAAEMGIGRKHPDAPAPPLVWPSWLTHINGTALRPQQGVDYAKNAMLTAKYATNVPMTELAAFYRGLMNSHEYPAGGGIQTGQTMTGIQQNALGNLEGFNYPDGAPGAHTVIHVNFDRSVLNGPITVTLRLTTYDYSSKRGY